MLSLRNQLSKAGGFEFAESERFECKLREVPHLQLGEFSHRFPHDQKADCLLQ